MRALGKVQQMSETALQWWTVELRAMFGESAGQGRGAQDSMLRLRVSGDNFLFEGLERGTWSLIAECVRDDMDRRKLPGRLRKLVTQGEVDIDLLLPRPAILHRSVLLPGTARSYLAEILAGEIERITPFSRDQILFDYVPGQTTEDGKLPVDVFIVKRDLAEDVLIACETAGFRPARLRVADEAGQAEPAVDFLKPGEPLGRVAPGYRWAAASLVAAAFAAVALLWLGTFIREARLADIRAEMSPLRSAAADALETRETFGRIEVTAGQLRAWSAYVPRVHVLDELAHVLPADTWVTEVSVVDNIVGVSGRSADTAALLGVLEASGQVHEPSFAAPIVNETDGTERFKIEMRLEEPAIQ